MAFEIKQLEGNYSTQSLEKESATVIAAGSLVALDASGYAIPAVTASTAVAFSRSGAAAGTLEVEASRVNNFTLKGTADANYAIANRGTEVDITDAQLVDLGSSATDVLKVSASVDGGTVGATTDVEVRINKHL